MSTETGKKTTSKRKTASQANKKTVNNKKAPTRAVRERTEQDKMISSELSLLILLAISVFLFLCNFNILGPVGNGVSGVLFGLFGLPAYITPIFIFIATGFIISNKDNTRSLMKVISGIAVFFIICIFIHLIQGELGGEGFSLSQLYETGRMKKGGGVLFGSLAYLLYSLLDKFGAIMVLIILLIACFVIITEKSFLRGLQKGGEYVVSSAKEDAIYRREQALRRKEEREAAKIKRQEEARMEEQENHLKEEIRETEKILRMDKKVSGVMLDTSLKRFETKPVIPRRENIHEITAHDLDEEADIHEKMVEPRYLPKEDEQEALYPYREEATTYHSSAEDQIHEIMINPSGVEVVFNGKENPNQSSATFTENEPNIYPFSERKAFKENCNKELQCRKPDMVPITGWTQHKDVITAERYSSASDNLYYENNNEDNECFRDNINKTEDDTISYEKYMFDNSINSNESIAHDSYYEENLQEIQKHHEIKKIDEIENTHGTKNVYEVYEIEDIHEIKDIHNIDDTYESDDIYETESIHDIEEEAYGERFEEMNPEPVKPSKPVAKIKMVSEKDRILKEAGHVEHVRKPREERPYMFPPISCLIKPDNENNGLGKSLLQETATQLQNTLQTFGVKVTIANISQGPTVTRYELQPQLGVKVSKIVSLTDDIKLNLAATDIRIEAPIPGKSLIGIEVPNKENSVVRFRELVESKEFKEFSSTLAFAVGKDIGGNVVVADIAKMPHMLIAGSTGSGKSVCINTLIISLLYKARPDEVKLIMIDPKVVELSVYNKIPHLLIPVVTDPKKAAAALHWGVAEMNDRYQKFADFSVRDLNGYNKEVEKRQARGDENVPEKLPKIVIIVDELADLMMVAPGEVEDSICRLAQLARAAGIHLIIATQRPSVDVITGLIKANMPSRVAFAVSSGVDSRTILDMNGAEKLLGKGDMLFYPQGYPKPVRVQGALVTDEEVANIVDFLKNQSLGNVYNEDIEDKIKSFGVSSTSSAGDGELQRDDHFLEAAKFIIEKDKASIGMLQRVFRIGYNRAARIMDQLADAGIVGEEEGTKPRKVLMSMEQLEAFIEEEY